MSGQSIGFDIRSIESLFRYAVPKKYNPITIANLVFSGERTDSLSGNEKKDNDPFG